MLNILRKIRPAQLVAPHCRYFAVERYALASNVIQFVDASPSLMSGSTTTPQLR